MPLVEIDDSELARLKGSEKLFAELVKSPKTKRNVEAAIKELHPEVQTTEDEQAPLAEEIRELSKEFRDYRKREEDRKREDDFQAKLSRYKQSADNPDGYTPEGIEKILTLMKERTIPDVDAAVALFEKQNPPKSLAPSGFTPSTWDFGKDKDETKRMLTDIDSWADEEAQRAWNDAAREKIGTFGQ